MKVTIDEDIFTVLGLRGLPDKYELFVQVVRRRKPWATFDEFITMLKEEDSPLFAKKSDSILKVRNFQPTQARAQTTAATGGKAKFCYNCKQEGHYTSQCTAPKKQNKKKKWCDFCKTGSHYTERCWSKEAKLSRQQKDSANVVSDTQPREDSTNKVHNTEQPSDDSEHDIYLMVNDMEQTIESSDESEHDICFMAVHTEPSQGVQSVQSQILDKQIPQGVQSALPQMLEEIVGEMEVNGSGSGQSYKRLRNFSDEPVEKLTDNITNINSILVDTGATSHIIKDKGKFKSFEKEYDSSGHVIELADGTRSTGWVKGRGTACFEMNDNKGVPYTFLLTNALYIPGYNQNILSVQKATNTGATFNFAKTGSKLEVPSGNVFDIEQKGKLYYLNHVRIKKKGKHRLPEWHKRMGHCNYRDLKALQKVVDGMHITDYTISEDVCGICVKGKQIQTKNKSPDRRAETKYELVHSDLTGRIKTPNIDNTKYVITFVDDFSGMMNIYFLKAKASTVDATEKYLADIRADGGDV